VRAAYTHVSGMTHSSWSSSKRNLRVCQRKVNMICIQPSCRCRTACIFMRNSSDSQALQVCIKFHQTAQFRLKCDQTNYTCVTPAKGDRNLREAYLLLFAAGWLTSGFHRNMSERGTPKRSAIWSRSSPCCTTYMAPTLTTCANQRNRDTGLL
jgi:hypothetical protein